MTPIRLDIFSDPVCPWCYIGKGHLTRALETRGDHPFQIAWHPFQLNPTMPKGGADRAEYLEAKFGGRARAAEAYARVEAAARDAGLEIDIGAQTRAPNTLDAHRLIHWAGIEGRQDAVVAGLFRAYWVAGADIGDAGVLSDVAAAAGMDRDATARLLQSDADAGDILARDEDARAKGVTAVPTFLIAQRYVVQGAQPPQMWLQVIDELLAQAATA
jgi:predicted DsbA family dithiol-disulfide isomerase